MKTNELLQNMIEEHRRLFSDFTIIQNIDVVADTLFETIKKSNKILVCGNGGSAADSQHFAAELIGRFEIDREAMPAIALTTDTSILTAVGNDYGYDEIFARQVNGLGTSGDVLIGISTSGNSRNIIQAIEVAKMKKMVTVGLLGKDGGSIGAMVDFPVIVPHQVTARIQEMHIFILHYWAAVIERGVFVKE